MYKFLVRPLPLRFINDKGLYFKSLLKLSNKFSSTPRPPKDPPDEGYRPESVDHQDIEISDFVRPEAYRKFNSTDEVLGPGAGKSKEYKNAQYFGYHRYSFYELQNQSMELRDERRLNGGIQINFGEDDEDECSDDTLEAMKEREAECEKTLAAQLKDNEKDKLKAWCVAIENKQEEILKGQISEKDNEKLKSSCKEIENHQQQRARKGHKFENNKKEMDQKTIDKRVKEILTESTVQLNKEAKGEESNDCTKLANTAADKAKENEKKPAVNDKNNEED